MDTPRKERTQLQRALQEVWGFEGFRPLQLEIMLSIMEGTDSLTVLPTGGGKSLCYQAPALCMEGLAVVISPLISLMKDQVDAASTCGIAAAFLNSSQEAGQRRDVVQRIENGSVKLLYVAPERLV